MSAVGHQIGVMCLPTVTMETRGLHGLNAM
jgi:hypothetical protein